MIRMSLPVSRYLGVVILTTILSCRDANVPTDAPLRPQLTLSATPATSFECVALIAGRENGNDEKPIRAGHGERRAGEICLTNTQANLILRIRMDDGWRVGEMQVAGAHSPERLPRKRTGKPILRHFPFTAVYQAGNSRFTQPIPLTQLGLNAGATGFLAVHAEISDPEGRREEAWAAGDPFVEGKSRGNYFDFDLAADVLVAEFIAPAGGTIIGPAGSPLDGVRLEIPPGAFAEEAVVTLGIDDSDAFEEALQTQQFPAALLGPVVLIESSAERLLEPAFLQLPYDDTSLPPGEDVDLLSVTTDADGGVITQRGDANAETAIVRVDEVTHTVGVTITGFSPKTVVGTSQQKVANWAEPPITLPDGSSFTPLDVQELAGLKERQSTITRVVFHSTDSPQGQRITGALVAGATSPSEACGNKPAGAHFYVGEGQAFRLYDEAFAACHAGNSLNQNAIAIELYQQLEYEEVKTPDGKTQLVWRGKVLTQITPDVIKKAAAIFCYLLKQHRGLTREGIDFHRETPHGRSQNPPKGDPRGVNKDDLVREIDKICPPNLDGTWVGTRVITATSKGDPPQTGTDTHQVSCNVTGTLLGASGACHRIGSVEVFSFHANGVTGDFLLFNSQTWGCFWAGGVSLSSGSISAYCEPNAGNFENVAKITLQLNLGRL